MIRGSHLSNFLTYLEDKWNGTFWKYHSTPLPLYLYVKNPYQPKKLLYLPFPPLQPMDTPRSIQRILHLQYRGKISVQLIRVSVVHRRGSTVGHSPNLRSLGTVYLNLEGVVHCVVFLGQCGGYSGSPRGSVLRVL